MKQLLPVVGLSQKRKKIKVVQAESASPVPVLSSFTCNATKEVPKLCCWPLWLPTATGESRSQHFSSAFATKLSWTGPVDHPRALMWCLF